MSCPSYGTIFHARFVTPVVGCCCEEAADFQMVLAPVALLRQNTSARPSPLKSPTWATCQAWLVTPVTATCVDALADRQMMSPPVLVLRQNTSDLPSPSKSPMPTTCQ